MNKEADNLSERTSKDYVRIRKAVFLPCVIILGIVLLALTVRIHDADCQIAAMAQHENDSEGNSIGEIENFISRINESNQLRLGMRQLDMSLQPSEKESREGTNMIQSEKKHFTCTEMTDGTEYCQQDWQIGPVF